MTAPKVNVRIDLEALTGVPCPNAKVTIALNRTDAYVACTFNGVDYPGGIIAFQPVTLDADANGLVTAACFPNHPTTGLGTTGSIYSFTGDVNGETVFRATAQIPGTDCGLEAVMDRPAVPSLSSAEAAQAAAEFAAGQAQTSATAAAGSAAAAATSETNAAVSEAAAADDAAAAHADRIAADADAASASQSASAALAVFGTADGLNAAQQIMLGYATTAQAQAGLAQGFASAAASVAQQDLSGASQQALHRSPNNVTALFVYDTSKDSDGGAWVDKCGDASWMNEPLNGTWLGQHASETSARDLFGTIGQASLLTGDDSTFTNGLGNWASLGGGVNTLASAVNGRLRITHVGPTGATGGAVVTLATVAGQRYRIDLSLVTPAGVGKNVFAYVGTTVGGSQIVNSIIGQVAGPFTLSFIATGATSYLTIGDSSVWVAGDYAELDNVTVKPVSFAASPTGAFYQLTSDGKSYKLWKNFLSNSALVGGASGVLGSTAALPMGWLTASVGGTVNFAPSGRYAGCFQMEFIAANNRPMMYQLVNVGVNSTYVASCYCEALASGTPTVSDILSFANPPAGSTTTYRKNGVSVLGTTAFGVGDFIECILATTTTAATNVPMRIGLGANNNITADATFSPVQCEFGPAGTTFEARTDTGTQQVETFRGNSAKFPRLSALVAEAASLTIYDLTQPGRPMWMRFVTGGSTGANVNMLGVASLTMSCVAAVNGKVAVGASVGVAVIDFATDSRLRYYGGTDLARANGGIAQRNAGVGQYTAATLATAFTNSTLYGVAMGVQPDAPADPATNLPVPTIAVITSGGASVIKQDGTIANHAYTWGTSDGDGVLLRDGYLFYGAAQLAAGPRYQRIADISGSSFTGTAFATFGPATNMYGSGLKGGLYTAQVSRRYGLAQADIMRTCPLLAANSLRVSITPNYNTGFMVGDIRRCWLSSTVVENLTATELVTNGTFNTDLSGWTIDLTGGTGSVVWSAGTAAITGDGTHGTYLTQPLATVAGKTYTLNFAVTTNPINVAIGTAQDGGQVVGGTNFNVGSGSLTFVAVGATTWVSFYRTSAVTSNIDNVSVQEVVADRCYKNRPLSIFGTIAKTAIGAASQLVAYSGFSAANYLRESYSADHDFGTAAWAVGVSMNVPVDLTAGPFPVIGAETFPTYDFTTATWTKTGTAVANSANTFTTTGSSAGVLVTALTVGKCYRIRVAGTTSSATGMVVRNSSDGVNSFNVAPSGGAFDVTKYAIWATNSQFYLANQAAGTTTITALSVMEVGPAMAVERSYSSGPKYGLGLDAGGRLVGTAYDGTTTRTVTFTNAMNIATWFHPRLEYTADGSLTLKVNGKQVAQATGAPLLTLNNASAVCTVGNSYALDAPFPGSLALMKIGATVPTAEQSAWMHEQEKELFRDGAQCVLPDANALVDLAYDEQTDQWEAVSNTYHSKWRGLVQTEAVAVPNGSYIKAAAGSGVTIRARSGGTAPGVNITEPSYLLREELRKRAQEAVARNRQTQIFDFDATTGQTDFVMPAGWSAMEVISAGASKREGSTKDWTRLTDSFRETIRFGVAPGNGTWVQTAARRVA